MDAITPVSVPQHKAMDTGALKKFAQEARRTLRDQVSAKLVQVLAENSAARREAPKAVQQLESEIGRTSRDQVIERVAYTWFNRFTALRFMDANGYTAVRVVTPADGQTRPEILSEAMAGVIGEEVPEAAAAQIRALLDNRTPSRDPQGEAYRLLLVAACNHWHAAMPFMFETIADYTELLMPEDLLSQGSILAKMRPVMTEEACEDVEVIGWLYQFYISEKKDEVFAGLKKNKKITPENIPAATQLFTPHWIVRYLVENSLGRLWMLNRPSSKLRERMDYFIAPEAAEQAFLRISSPEEIKVCDPACGSGHMLTYAFDLLYAIYEEEGYDAAEIPDLILTKNLYGIEIDERAGGLAAFALTMKAAARRKRFLKRGVQPNVCVLTPVSFDDSDLREYIEAIGRDLFTSSLQETLGQFAEADNFGSLIRPRLSNASDLRRVIDSKDVSGNLFLRDVHGRVLSVLRMSEFLSPRYHVVVANPPYLGRGGANSQLSSWAQKHYKDSRADLFAMFIERAEELSVDSGLVAMITMHGWMFLSTFADLRRKIVRNSHIVTMAHLGERAFDSIGGAVVSTTAFVLEKKVAPDKCGDFVRLIDGRNESEKMANLSSAARDPNSSLRSRASSHDFLKIPSAPIAYWVSPKLLDLFQNGEPIKGMVTSRDGLNTGKNELFIRNFWEVSAAVVFAGAKDVESFWGSNARWAPLIKGGSYRKWYGNLHHVITYDSDGYEVLSQSGNKLPSREFYFKECFSWTRISSPAGSFRYYDPGAIFESASLCVYAKERGDLNHALAFANSILAPAEIAALSPTVNLLSGYFDMLVVPKLGAADKVRLLKIVEDCIRISRADWDAYETSINFRMSPLLNPQYRSERLRDTYSRLRVSWRDMIDELRQLEEENNRIFVNAHGLQEELGAQVPPEEITLTCNPAYRYGSGKTVAELENLLRADTVREFLSYAVGCMFGRFSLDAPGLILASQGDGHGEYMAKVPEPTFAPDADNVIPILDGDWFADDIAARFRHFLRITFGDEDFQDNLAFVEEAIGKDVRRYFTRDFYNDHVKRYKKRPIYWLLSSPNGTFNALIYMHRYRPDTVSVVLNDYLREFRNKLEGHRRAQEALSISGEASPAQKTKALKEIEATGRQIEELDAWERDVLFPLATQKIEIDLDDGVKANYPKFGAALKPIKGLNDADD